MPEGTCPLRILAGFINGHEECDYLCALYVSTENHSGCALTVLAKALAEKNNEN